MSVEKQSNTESWTSLCRAPKGVLWNGHMIMINPYEFIIASECRSDGSSSGIYKYNVLHDSWQKFIQYPFNFESIHHKMTYNQSNNSLYIYGSNAQMTIIDISNYANSNNSKSPLSSLSAVSPINTVNTINISNDTAISNISKHTNILNGNSVNSLLSNIRNHNIDNMDNRNSRKTCSDLSQPAMIQFPIKSITDCNLKNIEYPTLLSIKGIIHILGGLNNNKHLIWSDHDHKFIELYDFKQNMNTMSMLNEIGSSKVIYSSNHEQIIMIKDCIESNTIISKIWIYSLKTMIWSIIQGINIPLWNIECILTSDERNLIISGGCDQNGNISDNIYVLNIECANQFILRLSNITLPNDMKKWHYLLRSGDNNTNNDLCNGYIKEQCKRYKCEIPPFYIIQMITNWFEIEMVHFIEKNGNDQHFAISVKSLLASV